MAAHKARQQASTKKVKQIVSHAVKRGDKNIANSLAVHGIGLASATGRMAQSQFDTIHDRVDERRSPSPSPEMDRLVRSAPGSRKGDD